MLILNMALNFTFVCNLEKITSVIAQTIHLLFLSPKSSGCLILFFLKRKENSLAMFNRNMKMGKSPNSPLQKKVLIKKIWPKHLRELGGHLILLFLKDHENSATAQFSFTNTTFKFFLVWLVKRIR
jgi:hypothetical protein